MHSSFCCSTASVQHNTFFNLCFAVTIELSSACDIRNAILLYSFINLKCAIVVTSSLLILQSVVFIYLKQPSSDIYTKTGLVLNWCSWWFNNECVVGMSDLSAVQLTLNCWLCVICRQQQQSVGQWSDFGISCCWPQAAVWQIWKGKLWLVLGSIQTDVLQ